MKIAKGQFQIAKFAISLIIIFKIADDVVLSLCKSVPVLLKYLSPGLQLPTYYKSSIYHDQPHFMVKSGKVNSWNSLCYLFDAVSILVLKAGRLRFLIVMSNQHRILLKLVMVVIIDMYHIMLISIDMYHIMLISIWYVLYYVNINWYVLYIGSIYRYVLL